MDKWEVDLNGGPIEPLVYDTNVLIPISLWFNPNKLHHYSTRAATAIVEEETGLSTAQLEHTSNNRHGYRNGTLGCEALFFIAAEGRVPTVEEASTFKETN